ncbi:Initiation-specific alpha-1,6-mannosyltransferase [Taphrina deformans PYCC 5710]|uniref:Initiation-specific alpha-1,6-mannosyltransferase n=1 Tax=Taphrina deformans (strain PYCC 5710 / ATCC 11124 / CBS 356.35 / IMI 108563 / JCM 9778 / NBRC 8474) TaxID=1097556 RepID=R4X6I9_TAPDE|nr:Initiation-specific alpha-1,6-mannosyltransferase [Taphrina deformans PYCC 5710]|eukprot:CCG80754.1 Initiation-specific alpha-1,6-mannosyltransferase [Taphrina deformans PYCC 5710]
MKARSNLSENANPEVAKDQNGNTKQDLATGVSQVIDSHRLEGRDDFDFPGVIHQTARTESLNPATLSWYYANVGEEHKHYTDREALAYVKKMAPTDVYEIYQSLPDPVARADLFRYIVLYEAGGVYADVDTTTLCQINAWIPKEFEMASINVVIGIEVDAPKVTSLAEIEDWGWADNFQFVQWTIMAKPHHRALKDATAEAITRVKSLANKRAEKIKALQLTSMDIIRTTGPGAFTAAMLKYLELSDVSSLRGLTKPVQVKDVLIMPVSSFAPNQRHSGSKSVTIAENIPEVLVMHGFQATRSWADSVKSWLLSKVY